MKSSTRFLVSLGMLSRTTTLLMAVKGTTTSDLPFPSTTSLLRRDRLNLPLGAMKVRSGMEALARLDSMGPAIAPAAGFKFSLPDVVSAISWTSWAAALQQFGVELGLTRQDLLI
eukprot:CAMPEP_0202917514 /NCGR_PEP_ID=MMETSP1392-20130828/71157_1 /ASSEMBLY_ACC=CAM_ASM_000868 /TAXON_ID=225041 /ORGANISM="Chlamydomonas chlamydogama, Strain SAG 11-48b" /LENGTH=114 /DNA_ID=CAMNT_0049610281 /DNA_START=497 /DNA_END=840 /DNA_ORIENTATION=+